MPNPDQTPVYIPEQVEKDILAVASYIVETEHRDFSEQCLEQDLDTAVEMVKGNWHVYSPAYRLMRFVEDFISK